MARARIGLIVIAACAVVIIAILVTRATIFAGSSSTTGLCVRELRAGQPASESLTAQAEDQTRPPNPNQVTRTSTPSPQMVEQAKAAAQARLQGGDAVVATVGDQPITLGQLRAQEVTVRQLQAVMQTNMAPPGPPAYEKGLSERVKLIQQAGAPNVALAGLISDAAVYQYALEQGCQPSTQEVNARVSQDKALADEGHDPGLTMYASVYGPDYWTTIYPETIRHSLATKPPPGSNDS